MSEPSNQISIVLVTSPGCHFCNDASMLLDELKDTYQLLVETVPMASEHGRSLVVRHRVPFPPIVMIDGDFFGYGRISRQKLEAALAARATGEKVG